MILAVLDTNVLASGSVRASRPGAAPGRLLALWAEQRFRLVVSDHILVELARTLGKPYFRQRLTEQQIRRYLRLLRQGAVRTPITVEVRGVATHPEDDVVLATAVSGGAQYLATGDLKLQRLGSYQGVRLLSPRVLVEELENV